MKKFYLFITLIFLFSYNNSKALSPGEIAALNDLKAFYGHFTWTGSPDCNWYGVTCNANGNVIELSILGCNHNSVNPQTIPASIGNLIYLEKLRINFSNAIGPIPTTIGNLTNLKSLDLSSTNLNGPIPNSIGNLTHLEILDLEFCGLTGSIPNSFYNLTNLKEIKLAYNNLTGSISPLIGNLVNLNTLHLYNNELSGSVPATIGNLSQLVSLILANNDFTGLIPDVFTNMSNLYWLYLQHNNFSGKVPSSIGNHPRINQADLSNNQLTDSVPNSFSNFAGSYLLLHNNQLTYIPNISNACFSVNNNRLQFNSLVQAAAQSCFLTGIHNKYAPQKKIAPSETKIVLLGNSLTLNSIPLTTANDQIQWFLNGNPIAGANSTSYTIPITTNMDLGIYTYEITNTTIPNITLEVNPILVIDTSLSDIPTEYEELFDLNTDLEIPFWTSYPSCNWAGITCDANNNITGIDLSNRNLSGEFSNEILNFSHLKSLKLNNNSFNYLPNLNPISTLDTLWIQNNKFTFDDILPNVGIANGFVYNNQDTLYTSLFYYFSPCYSTYSLTTKLINPNNQYLWHGPRIHGNNTNSTYIIDSLNNHTIFQASEGLYRCEVSNPSVSGLTIIHYFDLIILSLVPIELAYFNAALEEKNNSEIVNLNWATLSETNNNYFEIQRSSNNKTWKTIGTVEGKGNSSNLENYNFIDETPTQGNNYYRLKQTDFDGQFSVSEIRLVKIGDENNEISIHPNPAQNTIQIQFSQDLFQPVDLSIFSLDGKLLLNQQIQENNFNFDVSSLSAGIYLIKAKYNNQIITKRLLIQK